MNITIPNVGVPLLLELFNGGAVLLEGLFMIWALRYLWIESRRRRLGFSDWWNFRLPPSMNFIIAVIVFDFSSWLRALVVWTWRRFYDAESFTQWHLAVLMFAGILGAIGALCKIRAVTKPDYGDEPWLVCLLLFVLFLVASLIARMVFP